MASLLVFVLLIPLGLLVLLLEAVEPAAHAKDGVNPCLQDIRLSCLTEGQHGDNSENSLQNMTADTGFHAAFKIKLPPILCNGL